MGQKYSKHNFTDLITSDISSWKAEEIISLTSDVLRSFRLNVQSLIHYYSNAMYRMSDHIMDNMAIDGFCPIIFVNLSSLLLESVMAFVRLTNVCNSNDVLEDALIIIVHIYN